MPPLDNIPAMDVRNRIERGALRGGLLAAIAFATGCSPVESGIHVIPSDLPDILLISLDTLRADGLGCYGNERDTSPFLDRVAAEGVRFAEVHAPASNTTPSHMSLFTGLDPITHGVHPARALNKPTSTLSENVSTLAEELSSAGYRTASFSDRGGLPPEAGFGRGHEHVHSRWEDLDQKIDAVDAYLREIPDDKPLYLFFHTYEIHAPYLPPEALMRRFADGDYKGRLNDRYRELVNLPLKDAWDKKGQFLAGWAGLGAEDVRFAEDLYEAGVAHADAGMQRLWDLWSKQRDPERTLIVVFSDHGEEFFEHKNLGHRLSLHSELIRVPLIARGPGLGQGVVTEPVSLTALAPSLLELLGLPAPQSQVPSFADALRNPEAPRPAPPIYSQMDSKLNRRYESVASDGLRLLRITHEGNVRLELYAWRDDPFESRNLAQERPSDVERLLKLLDERLEQNLRWRENFGLGDDMQLDAERQAELEALGYAGEE